MNVVIDFSAMYNWIIWFFSSTILGKIVGVFGFAILIPVFVSLVYVIARKIMRILILRWIFRVNNTSNLEDFNTYMTVNVLLPILCTGAVVIFTYIVLRENNFFAWFYNIKPLVTSKYGM